MFFLYPHTHPYFEKSGTLTDKQLSARSRTYLYKSLEAISAPHFDESARKKTRYNLDMAYSSLSIHFYVTQYPCTKPSLNKIDLLTQQLNTINAPDVALFSRTLVPVLQCAEFIQTKQDNKRVDAATEMIENNNLQRQLLFWGACIVLTATIAFALMHLKQSKILTRNRNETHKWIHHAMHDSLMGIPNRRAFDSDLARHMESTRYSEHPLSLLMCDIDYFKQYNDALGHIEGDNALQQIAKVLTNNLRNGDQLYRYGGEEMAIILPNTTLEEAQHMGTIILDIFQKIKLPHPTSEFGFITMSIGSATSDEFVGDHTSTSTH